MQTTLDLLRRGITPYVLADGVSSCNKQEVPIALERLRQAGAIVTTSESILFELMGMNYRIPEICQTADLVGDASNTNFKPFAGLIKEEKGNTLTSLKALL
jgi:hypothetical protein